MTQSSARSVVVFSVLVSFVAALSGCSEQPDERSLPAVDLDAGVAGDFLAVSPGTEAPKNSGLELPSGETWRAPEEQRRAVLMILRGKYERNVPEPFSAEFVRSIDADLHQDIDPAATGPKQWESRAKVLDDEGNVLWSQRVLSLWELLRYLQLTLDQTSAGNFTLNQVVTFAKTQYPSLLQFPVRVPVDLPGASDYVLEIPDETGEYYEAARLSIDRILAEREAPRTKGKVVSMSVTGPESDRTDVAILGDGYLPEQRDEFLGDARAVVDRFEETEPFGEHFDYMNFRAIWTPSRESGAGYDCEGPNDTNCKRDFRDTVFRYTFAISALADIFDLDFPPAATRMAFPLDMAELFATATQVQYDEVILLSNSDRRSGFGGTRAAVLTAFDDRRDFPDVAVHEAGHTFGVLGDEYYIESDPCLYDPDGAPLPPNISDTATYDELKWNEWVDQSTPLPTPASARNRHPIGAYQRARNCRQLYRPAYICKMRTSSHQTFCDVCREQLTRRLYKDVDPVKPGYPAVSRMSDGKLTFNSGVRTPDRFSIEWNLDGTTVGSDSEFSLTPDRVGENWTTLRLTIEEDSGYVRSDFSRLRTVQSWQVRAR